MSYRVYLWSTNLPLNEGRLLWPGCCSGRPAVRGTSPASAAGQAAAAAAGGSGDPWSRLFGVAGAGTGASTGEGSRGEGCRRLDLIKENYRREQLVGTGRRSIAMK